MKRRRKGSALPPPLAGEGWAEGVSAMRQSPRGESPHPPRFARRPPPQAGEVKSRCRASSASNSLSRRALPNSA
ncbi:hypothetical protein CVM73_36540 [Bradyrhizobium forestalis]|uniref:Uncharacterized protein n=1 Tax=Bradyrhizobium forestalis TaxID=1419263 RepID=A0A2M8QXT4_9BRAD|nr:hypothetical protein CVM73_36540 [Bradyrhizobium forestalis]